MGTTLMTIGIAGIVVMIIGMVIVIIKMKKEKRKIFEQFENEL